MSDNILVIHPNDENPPGERHTFRIGPAGEGGIVFIDDSKPISSRY